MSHPKGFKRKNPPEHIGQWLAPHIQKILDEDSDDAQLIREVGMMHVARTIPTPNELIEDEIEAIERLKRDRVVRIYD